MIRTTKKTGISRGRSGTRKRYGGGTKRNESGTRARSDGTI